MLEGSEPRRVEASNLGRDEWLEGTVTEYQEQQRGEEERFDGHEEMAEHVSEGRFNNWH